MNGIYWIYIIENKINGKKYIGKTNNLQLRWKRHISTSKRCDGQYIHNALKKYGIDNFWFGGVCFCFSENEALDLEKDLIKINKSNNHNFGYNQTEGGEGSSGYKHTLEAKNKMSIVAKKKVGLLNPFYGKTHTPDVVALSAGENNKQAKLTEQKVMDMLGAYYTGNFTEQNLSKIFDIKRQTVNDILRGKRWKHIPRDIKRIIQVKQSNKVIGK